MKQIFINWQLAPASPVLAYFWCDIALAQTALPPAGNLHCSHPPESRLADCAGRQRYKKRLSLSPTVENNKLERFFRASRILECKAGDYQIGAPFSATLLVGSTLLAKVRRA